jgi:SAM-dependent methyltransferase
LSPSIEATSEGPRDNQQAEWEQSYQRRENYLFWPHEEVIRFFSRYIRKRIGLREFRDVSSKREPRVLDLGCGIGRHVIFAFHMGCEPYGVDLSAFAVAEAIRWASEEGLPDASSRIVQSDLRQLPWPNDYFDFAVSHGVLDSMRFEVARAAVAELARVTVPGGLFYCDLISGESSEHPPGFSGEVVVQTTHESGTTQSYFDADKIERLSAGCFRVIDGVLIRRTQVETGEYKSRYHLVLRRI